MTTSPTAFLAEVLSGGGLPITGEPIPEGTLAYFRERLKGRVHSFILQGYLDQRKLDPTITQVQIARRLRRRPEQINRWLSGASNMTLDTISDIVLAVYGGEPAVSLSPLVRGAVAADETLRNSDEQTNAVLSGTVWSAIEDNREVFSEWLQDWHQVPRASHTTIYKGTTTPGVPPAQPVIGTGTDFSTNENGQQRKYDILEAYMQNLRGVFPAAPLTSHIGRGLNPGASLYIDRARELIELSGISFNRAIPGSLRSHTDHGRFSRRPASAAEHVKQLGGDFAPSVTTDFDALIEDWMEPHGGFYRNDTDATSRYNQPSMAPVGAV